MHLVWREILTKFYKMASEKMNEILQKLNLGIQVEKFEQERIDPQVILASSDNELVRLGICTIGDRVRLRELCRASVESDNQSSSDQEKSVASRVANERNLLFAPGSTLNELDTKILNEIKIEEIEKEIEDNEAVVIRITEAKEKIEQAIRANSTNQHEVSNTSGNDGAANSTSTRLPKLQLTHFKGDVTKWRSFWDCFKAAVHSNQAISKIGKYNYLNSLLEGPAARAIQGLALTEANYNNAIELLQARFGKPQQVISAHMDELLRLPSCAGDKSSSLWYVYDKISVHVRGLEALGVSSKEYGSLLIPILMSKLPNDLRMRIARVEG